MLEVKDLADQLEASLIGYLKEPIKTAKLLGSPGNSERSEELSEDYAKNLLEMMARPLAEALASIIVSYIKDIKITGTIVTVGNKFTQTAFLIAALTHISGINQLVSDEYKPTTA